MSTMGIPAGTPIEIIGPPTDREKNPEAEPQDRPYIAFEHVSKSFGDVHVLIDVSFSVQAGETLCILGRSGVGKSVSLQQIMGFLKPDSGRIMVAGVDITNFPRRPDGDGAQESHHGLPEWRSFRFADGGRECGLSFKGARPTA
jgi:ABC-type multidrug transport system fused ATPase/permease subunit